MRTQNTSLFACGAEKERLNACEGARLCSRVKVQNGISLEKKHLSAVLPSLFLSCVPLQSHE